MSQEYNKMLNDLYNQHKNVENMYIKIKYETLTAEQKNAINDFISMIQKDWIIQIDQYTDITEETHVTWPEEVYYIIITGKLKSKL